MVSDRATILFEARVANIPQLRWHMHLSQRQVRRQMPQPSRQSLQLRLMRYVPVNFVSPPLLTHTKGNVCQSEYCYQGKCYDPPPCNFHGIENHDFSNQANDGDNSWVFSSNIGDPNPSVWISSGSLANLFLRFPTNQGAHYAQFEKEVEICPGKTYNLKWSNYRDGGSDTCTISMYVGDRKVGTQSLGPWNDSRNGPLQDDNRPQYEPSVSVSPFSFADAKRDGSGVRRNGLSLYAKVKGVVSCDGDCGTRCSRDPVGFDYYTTVRFGDVQMST